MLDKLNTAIKAILADLKSMKADVNRLKVRPVPKDGASPNPKLIVQDVLAQIEKPKDGVSPEISDIVAAVLSEIPAPKDGISPDIDAISFKVLAQIEKPKDGVSPKLSDIVSTVLARIPTPKDGVSPSIEAVAQEVIAQLPEVKAAEPGRQGERGAKGKDGVSVTKVKLEKGNKLAVWLDGVRRVVGTIEIPKPEAAFTPGQGGGTRRLIESPPETVGYTPEGSFFSLALQEGTLDTPKTILFGTGGSTSGGRATVGTDGIVTINAPSFWSIKQRFRAGRTGAAGVSEIFFWAELSLDNGATWGILGNSVDVSLNSSSDTVVFFDISDIQLPAGAKLRNRFSRSGTGDNSGDLRAAQPSEALSNLGVQPAPSAQITFYEIVQ